VFSREKKPGRFFKFDIQEICKCLIINKLCKIPLKTLRFFLFSIAFKIIFCYIIGVIFSQRGYSRQQDCVLNLIEGEADD